MPRLFGEGVRQVDTTADPSKALADTVVIARFVGVGIVETPNMQGEVLWIAVVSEAQR